jgi:hypothetical protein
MSIAPILQAGQLAAQLIMLKPKRGLYDVKVSKDKQDVSLPDIIAPATIEEKHFDRLELTCHPIEQGAAITDHAFANPPEIFLRLGWSNSSIPSQQLAAADIAAAWAAAVGGNVGKAVGGVVGAAQAGYNLLQVSSTSKVIEAYNAILQMYFSRAVFTLYTGKRVYENVICKMVATETDYTMENSLIIAMECQQLLLVNTTTRDLPINKQKQPESTTAPINRGTQQAREL